LLYLGCMEIIPFQPHHQPGIDAMMATMQHEFAESINSPTNKSIIESSAAPNQKFWVAVSGDMVGGSVGVYIINDDIGVLKRFFVAKEYRGKTGISQQLFDIAADYLKSIGIKEMYLGTMQQFVAAQHFYTKNGFREIGKHELPQGFPVVPVDKVFYHKNL